MLDHACNPNTWENKIRESEIQDKPQLYNKFGKYWGKNDFDILYKNLNFMNTEYKPTLSTKVLRVNWS